MFLQMYNFILSIEKVFRFLRLFLRVVYSFNGLEIFGSAHVIRHDIWCTLFHMILALTDPTT